jgi:hypothetical protein
VPTHKRQHKHKRTVIVTFGQRGGVPPSQIRLPNRALGQALAEALVACFRQAKYPWTNAGQWRHEDLAPATRTSWIGPTHYVALSVFPSNSPSPFSVFPSDPSADL